MISGNFPAKMSLVELQQEMMECHPGSPQWDVIWSAYQIRRAESEARRMWTSTAIALLGLVILLVAGESFVPWFR